MFNCVVESCKTEAYPQYMRWKGVQMFGIQWGNKGPVASLNIDALPQDVV